MTSVYVLRDPSGEIRYVGVTANPVQRLKRHLREWRGKNTHRANWMRALIESGQKPTMEVVELAEDWSEAERRWIAKLQAEGCRLVNGNEGGKTMHQARCRSESYPAIKRGYRVLESAMRGKHITVQTIEKLKFAYHLFSQAVAKNRRAGTLADLERRVSASRFCGAND
jgi:predicted GIY-YIG superfamily endonuclease